MPTDSVCWMRAILVPTPASVRDARWQPAADVYRTRGGWLIKFDLAGVRPEDVELVVQGQRLRVRGTRRDSCVEEGCRSYLLEISYSDFERTLDLPCDLGSAGITTEYRAGMLLVHIQMEADRP